MAIESRKKSGKVKKMVFESWLAFAFASMIFLSISNMALKFISAHPAFIKIDLNAFLIPIVLVGVGVLYAIYLFWNKLPQPLGVVAVVLVVFTLLGVLTLVMTLQTGKIALVTAVLSLSTVLVAFLSYAFLGDRFTGKEIAAMVMAVLSILILVL